MDFIYLPFRLNMDVPYTLKIYDDDKEKDVNGNIDPNTINYNYKPNSIIVYELYISNKLLAKAELHLDENTQVSQAKSILPCERDLHIPENSNRYTIYMNGSGDLVERGSSMTSGICHFVYYVLLDFEKGSCSTYVTVEKACIEYPTKDSILKYPIAEIYEKYLSRLDGLMVDQHYGSYLAIEFNNVKQLVQFVDQDNEYVYFSYCGTLTDEYDDEIYERIISIFNDICTSQRSHNYNIYYVDIDDKEYKLIKFYCDYRGKHHVSVNMETLNWLMDILDE